MSEFNKRIITSLTLLILLTLMYIYNYIFISLLIVFSVIIWVELNRMFYKIYNNKLYKFFSGILGVIYLTIFSSLSLYFFQSDALKLFWVYFVGICIVSDIGGYVFGKTFKGKKLSKVSPNKTISGSIGAFIFTFIFMLIFYKHLPTIDLPKTILISLVVSFFSQSGDLFISYLKRKANVKNSSNLLPGHGGLLDRLDGILFGVPTGIILISIIL